jgi:RNA polymerase sporulation-specific sigma factor
MRWHIRQEYLQDALQEGTLGLIEAVERYDHRRNVAFSVYAVHRIRGEILDFLKEENSRLALSIDEPDENGIPLREQLPDASEDLAERTGRQLLFEHVAQTLQRLPEKEQFVMEGVYLKDQEQKNIARDLSVSVPYVYRLQKRGIRRIRGMLSRFIHDSK